MAESLKYFRQLPNFEFISQQPDDEGVFNSYIPVKNLFRRVKIREDIFSNLVYFTNYQVKGDERPDQIAYKFYGDESLDWIVLISNNILNLRDEWPLSQKGFDRFLLEKYGTYDNLYAVRNYRTLGVSDSNGNLVLPKGIVVDQNYSVTYRDLGTGNETTVTNITEAVTNFQYEQEREDNKRNISLLKPSYVPTILDDLKSVMKYKKGSSQFLTKTLLRADDPNYYVD
tara:strand:- start:10999 stop:11682 length:684 start_codon:yes stop_codon:yes gene_type:complete